jgi:hypothetical protein
MPPVDGSWFTDKDELVASGQMQQKVQIQANANLGIQGSGRDRLSPKYGPRPDYVPPLAKQLLTDAGLVKTGLPLAGGHL